MCRASIAFSGSSLPWDDEVAREFTLKLFLPPEGLDAHNMGFGLQVMGLGPLG